MCDLINFYCDGKFPLRRNYAEIPSSVPQCATGFVVFEAGVTEITLSNTGRTEIVSLPGVVSLGKSWVHLKTYTAEFGYLRLALFQNKNTCKHY